MNYFKNNNNQLAKGMKFNFKCLSFDFSNYVFFQDGQVLDTVAKDFVKTYVLNDQLYVCDPLVINSHATIKMYYAFSLELMVFAAFNPSVIDLMCYGVKFAIGFKNGDTTNCSLENLYLDLNDSKDYSPVTLIDDGNGLEMIKDVEGYEGLYGITDKGNVFSYKNNIFLKQALSGKGYCFVSLCKDGKRKECKVHRLVMKAFCPIKNDFEMQVNHKDEIKTNNCLNNLEWCTNEYNNNYGTRNKRIADALGKAIYCVELNKTFKSAREAERQLNISHSNVNNCLKGRRKTAGGYHWKYAGIID